MVYALRRRLETLLRQCVRGGREKSVHDLRTTARKLQLYVPLAAGRKSAAFEKCLRRISAGTAKLRDMDVTLSLLSRMEDVPGQLIEDLRAEREREKEELSPILLRELDIAVAYIPGRPKKGELNDGIREMEASARRRLKRALPRAMRPGAAGDDLHRYRKCVRRLRYIVELSGSRESRSLRSVQDTLGRARDLELAAGYFGRSEQHGDASEVLRKIAREREGLLESFRKSAGRTGLHGKRKG